jgi:hypothetical protein
LGVLWTVLALESHVLVLTLAVCLALAAGGCGSRLCLLTPCLLLRAPFHLPSPPQVIIDDTLPARANAYFDGKDPDTVWSGAPDPARGRYAVQVMSKSKNRREVRAARRP